MARKRDSRTLGYKLDEWAGSKVGLVHVQQQCYIAEHELKMKQIRERHERELDLLNEEAEEKRQYLKLEHQIRMEILNLQKTNMVLKNKL